MSYSNYPEGCTPEMIDDLYASDFEIATEEQLRDDCGCYHCVNNINPCQATQNKIDELLEAPGDEF